jgi:DNA repair photolyase
MSGVTDCYQPIERRLGLTRACLEVLAEVRNPVGIVTKSQLVLRDLDLLRSMAEWQGVSVTVTVTSLDDRIAGTLEPRAARPAARLETIRRLAEAGVPVGANLAPVIPGLTETEIPSLLAAVREAGATFAGWTMLRLPWAVAPLFEAWLQEHYPARKERVLSRVRDVRGGDLYRAEFGERMKGSGIVSEQIDQLFAIHARRVGMERRFPPLSTRHFVSPAGEQLDLLGEC